MEVALTDINEDNLRMVPQLCQRDIEANGLNIKIQSTMDRRKAFKDAKYVVNCMRIGMLDSLTGAVCSPGEIKQTIEEMAQEKEKYHAKAAASAKENVK